MEQSIETLDGTVPESYKCRVLSYSMAGSASGQDEVNPVERARWAYLARSGLPAEKNA